MKSQTLAELVDQRWRILQGLLELGERQAEAVRHNRMSEMLAILKEKQPSLEALQQISQRLREFAGEDPDSRSWASPQARHECRERHDECERMLQRVMQQEAESESALSAARQTLGEQLLRSEGARRAASGYAGADPPGTAGSQIDLSSR